MSKRITSNMTELKPLTPEFTLEQYLETVMVYIPSEKRDNDALPHISYMNIPKAVAVCQNNPYARIIRLKT